MDGIDERVRRVIGRISPDVQQARRVSQVVCGLVIVAATLFSAPVAHVEPGVAVACVTTVGAVLATTVAGCRMPD